MSIEEEGTNAVRCLLTSLVMVAISIVCGGSAAANDGGLAYGGSPKLLKGHPSVSMVNEVVKMSIGDEKMSVDCHFTFKNDGPACTVRMGFPDVGEGADNPEEEGRQDPPKGTFNSFKSWVDGKLVPTEIIHGDRLGQFWHIKMVTLPANSTVKIRDEYTLNVSGSVGTGTLIHQTSYIVHTGSSWKGNIGRSEIIVDFGKSSITKPLTLIKIKKTGRHPNFANEKFKDMGRVYYWFHTEPVVEGKTLRFVRSNWRPTEKDDLDLVFAPPKQPKHSKKSASYYRPPLPSDWLPFSNDARSFWPHEGH